MTTIISFISVLWLYEKCRLLRNTLSNSKTNFSCDWP